ncbi:MAG: M48 family metallopeptidase [Flavobacteriales bacterium]|nr:M48 family metallopeptidase [Flavobacteriales bacterium]
MMAQTIFTVIVGILIFDYLLSRLLDYLDNSRWSPTLPELLKGIYNEEKYKKAQEYDKANSKFGLLAGTFSFIVMLSMLFFEGFAYADKLVRSYTDNSIYMAILFFGSLTLASSIINAPFGWYSTFVIEEKFGFNKTTLKTYLLDMVKGALLGALIGGGLLSLIVWFYDTLGDNFWVYTWIVVSGFSIFMAMFYTSFIVPIFNKLTPLPDGELRDEIEKYANTQNFDLKNIFVIDGSKRSTKANAYFSGLGSKKSIVLYDTLIENQTKEELVAILAHEVGHYKKKHTQVSIVLSVFQTGITFYIMSLLLGNKELSIALGIEQTSFHIGILVFGMLYSPISMVLGIGMNILSRKNEYEADDFAKTTYKAEALESALKKLSIDNLSNLTPHPLNVFLGYSHPTLLQRLENLKK